MSDERFEDHFSRAASDYVQARPTYPEALYEFIAQLAPGRHTCWDCATGNGQAAVALTKYFDEVIATDGSSAQLEHAAPHDQVTYKEALAHDSLIDTGRVDLVTVAAALHWFATEDFYTEVRRVCRPGGVLAAWSYGARVRVNDAIDSAVIVFAGEVLGPYWPPGFMHNLSGYKTLPFPFEPIAGPEFSARVEWTLEQMMHNISTWSGYGKYIEANGRAPRAELEAALKPVWGPPETRREVLWPLHYKVGRVV